MNAKLILRAIEIEAELEHVYRYNDDILPVGSKYDRLACDANTKGLRFRCELAEAGYIAGARRLRSSRAFDNCFENNDGDQVVAYLVEQAAANPKLEAAIASDFSGVFPESWRATAAKLAPQLPLFA